MGAGTSRLSQLCADCKAKFNILNHKRMFCMECEQAVCFSCAQRYAVPDRTVCCHSCNVLLTSELTYTLLIQLKTRSLRRFLLRHNSPNLEKCAEKHDLVQLILERAHRNQQPVVPEEAAISHSAEVQSRVHPSDEADPPPRYETVIPQLTTEEPHSLNQDSTNSKPTSAAVSKVSLGDIENKDAIDGLSVRQLKQVLLSNLVDYRGCKEKHELVTRVKMLWDSQQANKRFYDKLLNPAVGDTKLPGSQDEPELCRICMDAPIDCVLLECGHMITCTQCGKQMNECPICRQYVVRAVHIFRA